MSRRRSSPPNHYEREAWFIFTYQSTGHSTGGPTEAVPPSAEHPPFCAYGFLGDAYEYNLIVNAGRFLDMYLPREMHEGEPDWVAKENGTLKNRGKLAKPLVAAGVTPGPVGRKARLR
ncbi:MAG: hypothetical protein JNL96_10340 [Planctomycetaceae bacterium]|nr:hypothetical protein [Planctomycetaceae bacterium]